MNEPIRILHVLGCLNRGGAETMVMNIYRNIDRSKVQFDFIVHTKEKCDYDEEIKSLGGKIYSIPKYSGKNHLQYKKAWYEFLLNHAEYKIIHGHVRSTASIYLKIAKKLGLRTIAHSHNTSSGQGISAVVKNVFQYNIRYIADYLFACSLDAGEWLYGKKACKNNNFYIIKNAIDTKQYIFNQETRNMIRKEFSIENKYVIGNIGRFHEQKNHDYLIDIFKIVHDNNSNAVLMLVGEGELKESIEKKIKDLGISDNVIFTGGRSDVPDILQAMDVFVFPSKYEGLGIVVIEAQAAGLKCIVSDNLPKEVYMTDLIKRVSLKKSAEYWASIILKCINYTRNNTIELIKNENYDIYENTKRIQNIYFKIMEGEL